ncbi:MAG: nuclear transport factor 2 family protein [Bacteroidota bacterium]
MKTKILLIAGFIFSSVVQAQSLEEKEIVAAVETLRKAMIDADKTGLENLTADDLSYGHSSGRVEDKASFVESLVSGKSDFVTMILSDQTVKIVGTTALVRHKLQGDVNDGGKAGTINLGVLLVWQKQNGRWKLLARQAHKF